MEKVDKVASGENEVESNGSFMYKKFFDQAERQSSNYQPDRDRSSTAMMKDVLKEMRESMPTKRRSTTKNLDDMIEKYSSQGSRNASNTSSNSSDYYSEESDDILDSPKLLSKQSMFTIERTLEVKITDHSAAYKTKLFNTAMQ